jgi:HEPN domain-containing protein
MTHRKLAKKLLLKAEQDILVIKKLGMDAEIATEILGFHAQQAAEKMLKAALAYHQIKFPFTHRLTELIDALKDAGLDFPPELEEVRYLTPFAVEFRYTVLAEENDEVFDTAATLTLLQNLREWFITTSNLEDEE